MVNLKGLAIPAILMILLKDLVPESPKWLIENDRKDDAVIALQLVRPNSDKLQIAKEIEEITNQINTNKSQSSSESEASWSEVFSEKKAMYVGLGLMSFSSLTGINTINFYSTTIFGYAGYFRLF